jgi:hypothetical protein
VLYIAMYILYIALYYIYIYNIIHATMYILNFY